MDDYEAATRTGNNDYQTEQDSDRIVSLPGQPSTPPISQFSGYVTVNEVSGRALFYWFFEAQTDPSKKPLLLWLNGGPGCSSIGYGAAVELGPLRVMRFGSGLEFNEYAWNKEANLLFVESPVGVGFSYTNTSHDLTILDDEFVAEDAYSFLVNWLKRFPRYQSHDFYLAGESYAGHYVPQLAELVYDRNKEKNKYPYIKLKGFIVRSALLPPVGNPETDDIRDDTALVDYAWNHAVISDQLYQKVEKACDFKSQWRGDDKCVETMNVVYDQYGEIDIYNIYAPKCVANQTSSTALDHGNNSSPNVGGINTRIMRVLGGYDPCYSNYTQEYFNRVDVQKAFHANVSGSISGPWKTCSGDSDGRVPVIGTRSCIEDLNLEIKNEWRSWFNDKQVGGRILEYEGLKFVTVRGAGHLVPLNKPSEALAMINTYLLNQDLPKKP
ncbi:Serine carboxypeptidase-like 33 [Acorus calamus]|uniref:Carboxypeptidase n=1 Tax=Acorus calamus TaxID=4465 RepID=A0AAV9CV65_ACOCL|nr:Serine carboxypeptidase-like 33 [Acorus calamus]